jgi:hypothetical protein
MYPINFDTSFVVINFVYLVMLALFLVESIWELLCIIGKAFG